MTTEAQTSRPRLDLFLISVLILFLELACIRWFPAHVVFLSFFTNTMLLACFLGMSLGCLAARHERSYLAWTPLLLVLAVGAGVGCDFWQVQAHVGSQTSPQVVFFGTEYVDPTNIVVPIDVVAGLFFLLVTLVMVGPGQELGRALDRVPDRVQAYTINIAGSIAGIVIFSGFSWLQLPPFWWFVPVVVGLAYFLFYREPAAEAPFPWAARLALLCVMLLVLPTSGNPKNGERFWSPYYRIDYESKTRQIDVNIQGHQRMWSLDESSGAYVIHAYPLPHLLNRDSGGKPFQDVLIIGAGSGTDVSRALQWGAEHVDAVEIDPVIQKLGAAHHPNKPYQDERVSVHINDGRNFLRSTDRKYDLVLFALVDSLILHSGYSNIRLESYLFTRQAFEDVKRRLKPGGIFVVYNYFRQGWIVGRLKQELTEVFGEPLVLSLPYKAEIGPDDHVLGHFTVMFAGDTDRLRKTFERYEGEYWLPPKVLLGPALPSGFETRPPADDREGWERYGPAKVTVPAEPLRSATDDWPYLYLRRPMIPELSLRGILMMGLVALVLLWAFAPRGDGSAGWSFDPRMFFLGAGFMLIETKAVVHMALLFGSTWMVNSVVFFAVLVMILGANLFVLKVRPQVLWPYYLGLFVALGVNCLVPLDSFLGMGWGLQVALSCLLVFAPILFAGVIFAVSFGRTAKPDRAFGFNIAGAMAGGLAENTSMLLGFQYLVIVAAVFYGLSLLPGKKEAPLAV